MTLCLCRAILGKLIEEEKNKCEEEQRKVLFNLSALAGMDAMLGKHADAAEKYHTALEVSQGNRSSMSLDGSVEATLVGPASLRFEGPNGPRPLARPLGPIRWTPPPRRTVTRRPRPPTIGLLWRWGAADATAVKCGCVSS